MVSHSHSEKNNHEIQNSNFQYSCSGHIFLTNVDLAKQQNNTNYHGEK